jgi:hypothetical protein
MMDLGMLKVKVVPSFGSLRSAISTKQDTVAHAYQLHVTEQKAAYSAHVDISSTFPSPPERKALFFESGFIYNP